MKKIQTGMLALGLFAGGLVLGQAFDGDIGDMTGLTQPLLTGKADGIYTAYVTKSLSAKSAPQISQVADEARVRFEYIQIKQNEEIIRLLKEVAKK